MEHLGILSLLPPLLIIFLALVTKEVIFSLFAGIFFGYLLTSNWNPLVAMIKLTDGIASVLSDTWNIRIILFTTLLAAMVGLFQATGAAKAFGSWMASKVKSRLGTLIVTWLFGIFIFFDDYFNCLTIGTVHETCNRRVKDFKGKASVYNRFHNRSNGDSCSRLHVGSNNNERY